MLPDTTGKRIPKLMEKANGAIASSRKRPLSLSSQEGNHDIPRQRARTDKDAPAPVDASPTTTPPNTSLAATPVNPTPHATPGNISGTDETEQLEEVDDTNNATGTSNCPVPVDETPEEELSEFI
ncbi:hypothetical protein F5887DRAFT_918053 [Amanita rubescens]|nr:hypothetical protein F5887DRAFT_918053 [Amanita rubescens]